MKNSIIITVSFFLSIVAQAEYQIENGLVSYTASTDFSYALTKGLEVTPVANSGDEIMFSFDQMAVFRSDDFKESFSPLKDIENLKSIIDFKIPDYLIGYASLYQFYGKSSSVCRVLLHGYGKKIDISHFLLKLKSNRFDVQIRKNHVAIGCQAL